jgi:hypothetical protein
MNLDIPSAKRAYNWFHHSFPDYRNNEMCAPEDIMLRNKLEKFLLASGQ